LERASADRDGATAEIQISGLYETVGPRVFYEFWEPRTETTNFACVEQHAGEFATQCYVFDGRAHRHVAELREIVWPHAPAVSVAERPSMIVTPATQPATLDDCARCIFPNDDARRFAADIDFFAGEVRPRAPAANASLSHHRASFDGTHGHLRHAVEREVTGLHGRREFI
jgi:hypothetical protein